MSKKLKEIVASLVAVAVLVPLSGAAQRRSYLLGDWVLVTATTARARTTGRPGTPQASGGVPTTSNTSPKTDASLQAQSEVDKKLFEIMTSLARGKTHDDQIRALEQLIRDYPDYPRLNEVYSNLMQKATGGTVPEPDKVLAFADEGLAKYPNDVNLRRNTMLAKIEVLKAQKKDDAVKALAQKLLETETEPLVLRDVAWVVGSDDGPKFFEKAIAERKKNPAGSPSLGDITTSYALTLIRWGRKDEGIKLAREAVDEMTKEIADLEVLPVADPRHAQLRSLPRDAAFRCQEMANMFADAGDYQKALKCADLIERARDPADPALRYDDLRAGIYAKMGKPELVLEVYAKSFAANMDVRTRDRIRELAAKNGRTPEEIFDRARQIRKANARAIKAFELKTVDGEMIALHSLKAKAVLVTFFFPT